jgi:hypothetical protein
MPASLPGDTKANNTGANPSVGQPVAFDLISGPKGSPFDKDTTGNASTGALSTGIGYGPEVVISPFSNPLISNALFGIIKAGFTDDYSPGASKLDASAAVDSRFMYIGTGRTQTSGAPSYKNIPGAAGCLPYTAGFGIGAAGAGGSRDAGAGPAFTGFPMKTVTAPGAVAIGAVVEVGFTNRSGVALTNGQSTFGSQVAASAAVA